MGLARPHARATSPRRARRGHLPKRFRLTHPTKLVLRKAHSRVFDVRKLHGKVVKRERREVGEPGEGVAERTAGRASAATSSRSAASSSNAPAPGPDSSFDGLDFATWGAGHPPDTNGDVGPTYFIETVNTSIGIFDKSTGTRVAAFTFNSFMSQGHFGNLCDTDNFGDPVVLYDSFENRWFITDFAFKLDGSGNPIAPAYQCFAVSKTDDPVAGGWNFYSIQSPGGLNDYPKFGVWPDGIYMSANMFGFGAGGSFQGSHVWAINKAQMYAGEPTVNVLDFAAPSADFTLLPANARLQAGTPPAGTPEYFASTWEFLNGLTVYKLHVDWDKISTSTFTGPDVPSTNTCWPNSSVANIPTPANALDSLQIRAMAQAQYSNIGGTESLWVDHTVRRGEFPLASCGSGSTTGAAAVRWYQANVTGGTVNPTLVQAKTWDPDGTDVLHRWMPSLAVDRSGDLAVGYSLANSTTNPKIMYAGRLAGDPVNTFSQGEQTLIAGTGSQSGNCGSGPCARWGDYSSMSLDPNGCEFWMANEYYAVTGLNDLTRIGSFHYPGCTPVGNGTLGGTVTDGANPLAGVTLALGARTTTTDSSGNYSFTVPAGTYPSLTATKAGYDPAFASSISVPDGGSATRNFTLNASSQSGCLTDNSQSAFQPGIPSNCDLTSNPGNVQLASQIVVDQKNESLSNFGVGITTAIWGGQTFTPGTSGSLTKVDLNLFCSACTGTTPNLTLSIRATSGGLPTGADLGTATIPGFNSGAAVWYPATFASPLAINAGTQYALIIRPNANPSAGTYALTRSASDTYLGGARISSSNSGSTWTTTTTDTGFRVYVNTGFPPSGTFVSSLKDANPAPGHTPNWTTLSWSATTPAGTGVKFQVAASNNSFGPFNYVGPDGTASTFFTTSGASLAQFNGSRYLRYKAYLSTNSSSSTPALSSVTACFDDIAAVTATSLAVDPATGTYGGTTNLTATLTAGGSSVSGKSVAFTLNGSSVGSATTNGSGVATLNGASLSGINAGSYPSGVHASFSGDSSYGASSGSNSLDVAQADQAITISAHAPSSAVYGTNFSVAASGGGSGNAVTFSSAGVCTNTGNTFTMTSGTGTCTVKYDQAGDSNYKAAPQLTESVTAEKASQTITFPAIPDFSWDGGSATLQATASSGLGISYSIVSGPCGVSAGEVTANHAGTCVVAADQGGDSNYAAAAQVTRNATVLKADQSITVTTNAPSSAVYLTSFGVAASAPGGAVTFSSGGVCSNNNSSFTMTSGTGTCTVNYDQAGNSDYKAAPQVSESVTAEKASQTITIVTPAPADAAFNSSFTVAAGGGGSGNPIDYSSDGVCTNSGATFTMTSGAGTCTVKYDQAGDDNYDPAPQVTESVTAKKGAQTITVTTPAPSSAVYGSSFTVAATGGASGNPITFSSAGVCTNSGDTFTMTSGTGACTVKYDQAGDADYAAAPQVTESVTAQKASQTITVTTNAPSSAVFGSSFDVAATGGASGNPVTFSSAGACTNSGATFTMTSGTGTCSVNYDQAGDSNYAAASQVTESVSAQKADQMITVTTSAPSSAVYLTSFGVAASAPAGPVTFSSGGVCSHSGSGFTMTSGTGTCTVKYDQAGNANYNAAPQVTESVTAQKASQTISFGALPDKTFGDPDFTVSATASSGLSVSFAASGQCTVSSSTVHLTAVGSCTITASQGGNDNYSAAADVPQTFQIGSPVASKITDTSATCSQFAGGSASPLASLLYALRNGKISDVQPRSFVYWVKVTASAGSNTFTINQAITSGNFSTVFGAGSAAVYTSTCGAGPRDSLSQSVNGNVSLRFNASVTGTYFLAVTYKSTSVKGQRPPNPNTAHYEFSTQSVSSSTSGIDLSPRPAAGAHRTKHVSRFFWLLRR